MTQPRNLVSEPSHGLHGTDPCCRRRVLFHTFPVQTQAFASQILVHTSSHLVLSLIWETNSVSFPILQVPIRDSERYFNGQGVYQPVSDRDKLTSKDNSPASFPFLLKHPLPPHPSLSGNST